jgi:hypothetical protein
MNSATSGRDRPLRRRAGWRAQWRGRGEEGQALMLVLLIALLLAVIVPIVVSTTTAEDQNVGTGQTFEAALAAAEAGVQQYRNLLNTDSDYWEYNASNLPPSTVGSDPALTTWETLSVPSGAVQEAFHYIPNASDLGSAGSPNLVVLTVTGRAGDGSTSYQYRTIQVGLQSSGILTNAYFSQYELLDPAQNTTQICQVTDKSNCVSDTSSSMPQVTFSYENSSGQTVTPTEGLWTALCEYETFQPNLYVDSLDSIPDAYAGGDFDASHPYYGPYRGNEPNYTSNASNTFETFAGYQGGSGSTPGDICANPFEFGNSETFAGPVYTNDQLFMCPNIGNGNAGADFEDGLTSGITPNFSYLGGWPTQYGSYSGTNGWIDDGEADWDGSCGFTEDGSYVKEQTYPNFNGTTPAVGGTLHLPPLTSSIGVEAASGGCVYTGPTMIAFYVSGSTGKYNVWSPLTSGSAGTGCGTFSIASPSATVTIPSTGLAIYVQNAPSSETLESTAQIATLVSSGALPTGATCANPWKPYTTSGTTPSCATVEGEGDAIVEGEVRGQVTVGTAANIVISRDITYDCAPSIADQESGSTIQSSAACTTPGTEDILGLAANGDIVIGHPGVVMSSSSLPPNPLSTDDVAGQTEPYEWPAIEDATNTNGSGECTDNGQESSPGLINVVPDCEIDEPVIDAALVALHGSFADEDWDIGDSNSSLGTLVYIEGTDISFYRGPFSCDGAAPCPDTSTGYDKDFSYDARLQYLTPPDMINVAGLIWNPTSFVSCGDVNDVNNPSTVCSGLNALDS